MLNNVIDWKKCNQNIKNNQTKMQHILGFKMMASSLKLDFGQEKVILE